MAYWVNKPRKSSKEKRFISLHVRVNRIEEESILRAARARGIALSVYMREALLGNIKRYRGKKID